MAMEDFLGSWYVTAVTGDVETCTHQIDIGGSGGAMTVQCLDSASHQYLYGSYQEAGSDGPERIEMGSYWITLTPGGTSEINYGACPSCPPGEITGSWTASDHPWQPGGTS